MLVAFLHFVGIVTESETCFADNGKMSLEVEDMDGGILRFLQTHILHVWKIRRGTDQSA